MKKILLFFVLFMSMSYVYGQIEVLNETFDQCAMPAGWSVDQTGSASLTPGPCENASFSFECLHNPGYSGGDNPAFSGCVAVMDDDYNSSVTGIYYIISPVVDFSGGGDQLTFDYEHADFAGSGDFYVEVWDGATWVEVFNAPNNDHYASETVDLSTFYNADAQIRFAYDDDGGWYWGSAFDNVIVTAFEPINPGDFSCILDCPGDLEIFLDPGDCCWNVEYDARTVGDCINHYQNIIYPEPPLMGFVGDWDPSGFPVKTTLWYEPFNYSHVAAFSPSIAGNPNPWPYYDLNNLPDEIVLTTNNHPGQDPVGNCTENGLTDRIAYINWLIPENGTVSFDWDYVSNDGSGDPYYDWFAEARVNNPTYVTNISWATTIADPYSGDPTQSGTFVKNVTAGDYLCLLVQDWGEVLGSAGCGATVTLTNFTFSTPQPTSGIFVVEGPVPGEEVCPGEEATVKLMLMENNTPIDSCEFDINVNEYPNPTTTLACNDYVQVSLDSECSAVIGADMILEGGPYSCYEDYLIEVLGVNDGNPTPYVELDAGFYEVGVWDADGNNCWSTVEVLDKIPPQILCETCPEGGLIQPGDVITELAGELSDDDPQGVINPCWVVDFTPAAGNHPIDVLAFAVDADGAYDLVCNSSWGDGEMAIYDGPVNFDDLCENWIAGANDNGGVGFFDPGVFGVLLNAGQTYYVATSNYVAFQTGNYSYALSGDGNFIHAGLPIYSPECTFYGCNAPGDVLEFPEPEVIENCTYEVTFVDEEIEGPVCGSKFLRRTYTVTDGAGMSATCSQEFLFTGINLDELAWPTNWDGLPQNNPMLECNIDEYPTLPNGNPHPSYTGYPEGYEDYCGTIEVFFNDINYTSACGPKILREWTVIDDCTAQIFKHIQIIRITDTEAPVFVMPENLVANTKGYVCNADFEIPAIMHLEDACDAYPQWFATTNAGFIVGDENENGYVDANETWYVLGVPMGTYELCYTAVDWCGNYYTECATLTVEDHVPPIPVCEQYKQVSLTPLGDAKVYAEDFDSGSFDNCGPVWFKVLRGYEYNNNNELVYDGGAPQLNGDDNPFTSANDVWFDDDVFFDCNDLGLDHPDGIMVTLRVFDVDPGPGPVSPYDMYNPNGRLYGHYNDCWTVVEIECKIPPLVTAPNLEVSCEANIDPYVNTALFPDIVSVCGYEAEYTDSDKIGDVCGGYIQRTWTVTGCGKTVTKVQNIYMTATEPFDPCTISFPADETDILCPDNTGDPGYPTWDENPCNIVTAEIVNIDTFTYVDGACYKIVVDWAVVDWCVYQPNTGAEDNLDAVNGRKLVCSQLVEDGYYRYTQILMVTDIYAPEITVEDQCVATTQGCYAYDVEMFAFASDECNVDQKFWWKYIVTNMDTWETVQYSYNYTPTPNGGQKGLRSKDNLDKTAEASLKFINPLPLGNYRVEWTVGDGCGNATSTYQYFTVADKKPPTPFLVDISTALMTNGMVEMSARFFDKGACNDQCLASFDECSDVIYFTFTNIAPVITRPDWIDELRPGLFVFYFDPETGTQFNASSGRAKYFAGDAHYFDPVLNTAGKVFFCSDAPATNVDVYVWDNPVNWADGDCDDANYDFATVLLNLNDDGDCGGSLVSGMITANHSGQGIDNVVVAIDNENSTEYPKYMNTTAGEYAFGVLDGDYSVTPTKRDDYLNGVTTLDLVLIQKHLLGLVPLNGDKLIAADANASNSVSAADLFELRELILGVESELNSNDSWVFVPGSQDIVVDGTDVTVDFGGIKVGDVNGSADAVEPRSANSVSLVVDEAAVEAGLVEVAFTADNFTDVYGGQATLNVDGMKYAGVEAGALNVTDNNFGLVRDGVITMSWNNANGTTVADGTVLFTLKLEASQNGSLSSMISATSDVTAAEAYTTENLDINGLNISFRGAETVAFELFQNEPNPFAENTVIGFNLPEAGNYTLTVFDVTGKVVKVVTNEGDKGYNSERLDRNDISSGVMYYQLESGEYTATKKMIIIE